jgi:hypothetical protein
MQLYTATLLQLVRNGAKRALTFADREARQLAPGAESRVVRLSQKSVPQKLRELINYGYEYRNQSCCHCWDGPDWLQLGSLFPSSRSR